jgi:tRNA G37 N-methylase Trm5
MCIKELVKPSMTFLDVVAGVGSYSIPAAKRGLGVTAIEPDPISFQSWIFNWFPPPPEIQSLA